MSECNQINTQSRVESAEFDYHLEISKFEFEHPKNDKPVMRVLWVQVAQVVWPDPVYLVVQFHPSAQVVRDRLCVPFCPICLLILSVLLIQGVRLDPEVRAVRVG